MCVTAPSASIAALIWISGGTRSFRPLTSSGELIGRRLLVMERKPHSKLAICTKPILRCISFSQAEPVSSSVLCACAKSSNWYGMKTTPKARLYLSSCVGDRIANSITPSRACSVVSGGDPSALLGNILILTWPAVRSSMRFTISSAARWLGCCTSAECVSLYSAARAVVIAKDSPRASAQDATPLNNPVLVMCAPPDLCFAIRQPALAGAWLNSVQRSTRLPAISGRDASSKRWKCAEAQCAAKAVSSS